METIDVSRCEFFTPISVTVLGGSFETQTYCGQANALSDNCKANLHCKNNPNCYFKQLARANEEIEKLKSENFTFEELIKIQEKVIAKNEQALDEIEKIADENLCEDDCDWKEIKDIINKAKEVNNAR